MTTFFVGQRVRIKYSLGWPELAGEEGRIVDRAPDGGIRGESEWDVAPDRWGATFAPRTSPKGGKRFSPNSRQIEPIQPEGHQPSEFTTLADLLDSLKVSA